MSTYRVTFHVASSKLTTLLDTVKNTDGIRLANVTDLADPEPLPKVPPPARAPAPIEASRVVVGTRVTGDQVALEVLRSGPATLAEVKRAFVNRNFAPATAANYLSRLVKTGHIRREGSGRYTLGSTGNGRVVS